MAEKKPKSLNLTADRLKRPKPKTPDLLRKPTPKRDTRYVVKSGDSLARIARANGTTVASILKINPALRSNPKYQGGSRIFRGTRVRLK